MQWAKNLVNHPQITRLLNKAAEISHKVHTYFKDGSFGVAVYPFLMHPCFRKSCALFLKCLAVLASFLGVYYLFGELITASFSEAGLTAYFRHSTLELLTPVGTVIEEKEITLSPLWLVMNSQFVFQSLLFFFLYALGISHISDRKYRLFGLLFALFFSVGCMLIATSKGGKFTAGGLQSMGASLTFLFGNLTLLITGLELKNPKLAYFKKYSLIAGFIGFVSVITTLFWQSEFSPMLERISIYTIMIWEILAGFAIAQRKPLPL
ncbi:hypothetical protein B0187_01985 [Haemophilus paracuniculus]|uniref:DUF998 domain-containing protein n=1 Tax=Haemophilus paracuniculus TaxID=734 RepID=A0A1T0AUD4_9PAST|nr:hypothetical protein [Haemophilus paracuniculus]OOS00280.1 hypothetical protein B0187_01985 [Haemophilus paracuniculus]